MSEIENPLERWTDEVCRQHIPRWKELPEIDLYMDQVLLLLDKALRLFVSGDDKSLTGAMVNNYVKAKSLPPPVKKRYNRAHLARLTFICVLKPVLSLGEIQTLLLTPCTGETLPAVYDGFCESLESAIRFLLDDDTMDVPSFGEDNTLGIDARALNLALLSAACKTVAQKWLAR